MAVHFIHRCLHATPLGRRIVHYPDKSLYDWFVRNWVTLEEFPDGAGDDFDYDRAHELVNQRHRAEIPSAGPCDGRLAQYS